MMINKTVKNERIRYRAMGRERWGWVKVASLLILLANIAMMQSCSRKGAEDMLGKGEARLNVRVESDTFRDTKEIKIKGSAATPSKSDSETDNDRQRAIVPLDNGFTLIAELAPVSSGTDEEPMGDKPQSMKNSMSTSSDSTLVNPGVTYKVVVYDAAGNYVAERDYTKGSEAATAALALDAGASYTFVAYSLNNTASLPPVVFADPTNKTLANSSVQGVAGNVDLMYFKTSMTLTAGATNFLSIVFSHQFSQIAVKLDASATGYNITSVTSNFDSHYPTADLKLADGSLTRTGTVGNVNVVFPTLGGTTASATPVLLNNETDLGKFMISSLTIGR